MPSAFLLPLVFFLTVGIATLCHWLPPATLPYLAGASLVTFIAYYLDKSAARNGSRRIRENTLHLLSLAGGWPGALIARHRFRHKTRKQPFRLIFWLTVMGNIALLAWAFTSDGLLYLQNLIHSYL